MKMKKILSILLAVCFLMSVTAVAVSAHGDYHHKEKPSKTIAKDDDFKLDSEKNTGNVLGNDEGKDLKVVGISDTTNGGEVKMKKNGDFTYKPPYKPKHKHTIKDSFKYAIKGKDGKISFATVNITYKFIKHHE